MEFEQLIKKYITEHSLLKDGGLYLVALSGGPDSVALLRVLKDLGYTIEAAHCNFHLRGEESNRDETFCKQLCEKMDIPFHVVHFDTITYAQLHKVSIEMAARNLRYHWFAQLCHDIDAAGICVAHHQDDQVETVLLNILRGTGIKGLTGMKPKTKLHEETSIIRPLLCVNEEQILDYLKTISQDYVIDSTNLEDDVQRNKLRLDIIPLLEKVTPAATRNIIRMTENLQDVQTIVDASLKEATAAAIIPDSSVAKHNTAPQPSSLPITTYSASKLHAYVSPLSLLWHILSPFGFNRSQVEEATACIAKDSDNKEWQSRTHIALLSHGLLYIIDRQWWEQPLPTLRIPEPGTYRYGSGMQQDSEPQHLRIAEQKITNDFTIPKSRYHIAIDASKVSFPLTLRPIQEGDRFTPFGLRGKKLVSDYLKDRHRTVIERHRQLVLTDSTGSIVWLVGECIADSCKVTITPQDKSTNSVFMISFD